VAHYVRRYLDDLAVVEAYPSYGAAIARANTLLAGGARLVEIFDVDPRAHPEARVLATRLR